MADSSRELVLWAVMPPSSWICFPRFFSDGMPPRGPLELWLQHADCDASATGAEVEVVALGKVYMTVAGARSPGSTGQGVPS